MPNFVNFVVTNAINSKEQYCCTPAGVSNLLKISTVVDIMSLTIYAIVSNLLKISTVVDYSSLSRPNRVSNLLKISTVVDKVFGMFAKRFKLT